MVITASDDCIDFVCRSCDVSDASSTACISSPRPIKAIIRLADDAHSEQLFDFATDVLDDADPFVRGWAYQLLGELDDSRTVPIIDDGLDDDHEFVRARAAEALDDMDDDSTSDIERHTADELARRIRGAEGAKLTFLTEELTRHPDGLDVARELILEDGNRVTEGLRALERIGSSDGRDIIVEYLRSDPSSANRAAALRALAELLEGDLTDDEAVHLRRALESDDAFVVLAGIESAMHSGRQTLLQRGLDIASQRGLNGLEDAAKALSKANLDGSDDLAGQLVDLLGEVQLERKHAVGHDWVMCEAYLIRALRRSLSDRFATRRDAIDRVRESLRANHDRRPIAVTALEFFEDVYPDAGLPPGKRWHPSDASLLVRLGREHSDDIERRAVTVAGRVAPPDTPGLASLLRHATRWKDRFVVESLIPAIRETRIDDGEDILEQLVAQRSDDVSRKASEALRRLRNSRNHIDVNYSPTDDVRDE